MTLSPGLLLLGDASPWLLEGVTAALRELKGVQARACRTCSSGPPSAAEREGGAAARRPLLGCLDAWILTPEQQLQGVHTLAEGQDLLLISVPADPSSSTAGCSSGSAACPDVLAGLPAVLIVDAQQHSTAAAVEELLSAHCNAPASRPAVVGVLFHSVASLGQAAQLAAKVGPSVSVLGALPLVSMPTSGLVSAAAAFVAEHLQLELLQQLAGPLPRPAQPPPAPASQFCVQIAVAQDAAFRPLFAENLLLLERAGAHIVPFSPLLDAQLPAGVSMVYISASMRAAAPRSPPHSSSLAAALAANRGMVAALRAFAQAGGLVLAEGAGLACLAQSVQDEHQALHAMAGVLPCRVRSLPTCSSGRVEVSVQPGSPLLPAGARLRGSYQHCAEVAVDRVMAGLGCSSSNTASSGGDGSGDVAYCYAACTADMLAAGQAAVQEGYACGSALASFAHLHFGSCPAVATHIVQRCLRVDVATTTSCAAQAATEAALAAAAAQQPATAAALHNGSGSPLSRSSSMVGGGHSPGYRRPPIQSLPNLQLLQDPQHWQQGLECASSTPDSTHKGLSQHSRTDSDASDCQLATCSTPVHIKQRQHSQQLHQRGGSWARQSLSTNDLQWLEKQHAAAAGMGGGGAQGGGGGGGGGGGQRLAPFSVPKRWSMDLQRSLTGLLQVQHANQQKEGAGTSGGGGGGRHHSRNSSFGAGASGGGTGGGAGSALRSRVTSPRGGYVPEPLPIPEHASKLLDSFAAPGGSHTHHKLIGLACPLSASSSALSSSVGKPPVHPPAAGGLHQSMSAVSLHHAAAGSEGGTQELDHQQGVISRGRSLTKGSSFEGGAQMMKRPPSVQALHLLAAAEDGQDKQLPGERGTVGTAASAAAPRAAQWQPHAWGSDSIVSLGPAATDCIAAMGLTARLAGITDACQLPPPGALGSGGGGGPPPEPAVVCRTRLAALQTLRGARSAEEALAALAALRAAGGRLHDVDELFLRATQPAVVIVPAGSFEDVAAGELERRAAHRALERAGLLWPDSGTTVLYQSCATLCEVLEFMAVVGAAADAEAEARALLEQLRRRLRAVAAAVYGQPQQQRHEEQEHRHGRVRLSGGSDSSSLGANSSEGGQLPSSCPSAGASSDGSLGGGAGCDSRPPRVLVLDSLQPLSAAGRWAPELVQLAGGLPVGGPTPGGGSQALTWQAVRALAPEVLVIWRRGLGPQEAAWQTCELAALPGFWALPAVRAGAVYVFDHALLGRPGPRLVEGVEALAHALHPSAWPHKPSEAVLKLTLRDGQRCRPRLLPNYFAPER